MLWFIPNWWIKTRWSLYLNTSYVMVHRLRCLSRISQRKNLNTSYVMVHPAICFCTAISGIFKYILCYGSSLTAAQAALMLDRFKYILCYGSSLYFKPFLKCDILILPVFKRFLQIFTNRLTIFSNFV